MASEPKIIVANGLVTRSIAAGKHETRAVLIAKKMKAVWRGG
jgi:hypothetical protein